MFLMRFTLGFTIALLALFQGECFLAPPTITCSRAPVFVAPGTCVAFTNPCADNLWKTGDTFRIDGRRFGTTPPGITVVPNRSQRIPTFQICAAQNTAPVVNHEINYDYHRGLGRGEGVIDLTVPAGTALAATASANPALISVGETSQLSANVTGGNARTVTFGFRSVH